jgi:hypothetical protein
MRRRSAWLPTTSRPSRTASRSPTAPRASACLRRPEAAPGQEILSTTHEHVTRNTALQHLQRHSLTDPHDGKRAIHAAAWGVPGRGTIVIDSVVACS